MAKLEQVLLIEPNSELRFRGPFTETAVTSYIKLTNPTVHNVYFKIKTTAPKRYCVRPNCGLIRPKGVYQIAVTLQPFEFDPVEKTKHKFMVQSLIGPDNADEEFQDVWKDLNPDQLMDSKLKCIFENPVSNTVAAKRPTTTTTTKTEGNTNNGQNKGVAESLKATPKVLGEAEEKLKKAAQEVNQLRVEESNLRQENLQLKEDLLKLRSSVSGSDVSLTSTRGLTSQSSNQWPIEFTTVVISILFAILGYLLGKMI